MATVDQQLALAGHYLEVGRPKDALQALDEGLDEGLSEPEYWLMRSRAHYALNNYSDGAGAAQRGLSLDPQDIDLLNLLALCQLEGGAPSTANATIATALLIDPDNHVLLSNRGLVLARMKRFTEARYSVDEAVRLAPWSSHALRVRAQVAVLDGDKDAKQLIDELIANDPEDEFAHALKGNIASRKKNYVAASRAFDQAARLDPGNEHLVGTARRARVAAHPLLAPLRPIWRIGWFKARLVFLALFIALTALGYGRFAFVLFAIWIALIVLSWTAPRYVRWRAKRRYGEF